MEPTETEPTYTQEDIYFKELSRAAVKKASPKSVECAENSGGISVSGLRQNFFSEKLQFLLLRLLRVRMRPCRSSG